MSKPKRDTRDRQFGTMVRWCFNPKCRLEGVDQPDDECAACKQATVRLVHAIVCTDKRGVFMGLFREADIQTCPKEVTGWNIRMAVRWTNVEKGVLGLAQQGPGSGCRISAPVPETVLKDVHAVIRCSPEAVDRWEEEPWGA